MNDSEHNDSDLRELQLHRLHELRHKGGLGVYSASDEREHELTPEEDHEYRELVKLFPDE